MSGYNTFGLVELHPPFVALGFASFDSHTRNSTALKTRISYRHRNSCSFGLLRQHQNPSTPYRNSCHSSDEGDVNEPPSLEDEEEDVVAADNGITVQITKLGKRSRRIQSSIQINASLYVVWDILTDYERLADFIPGLATSKVLQKSKKFARLFQVGQQNLVFGLKFNAEGIIDCYEKELQILSYGLRRDIEFRMVEGDFKTFEGKWSIEQHDAQGCAVADILQGPQLQTVLSYVVDVEPKLWLPVGLVQGRLSREITSNLVCIRNEAQRLKLNALHEKKGYPDENRGKMEE